MWLGHWQNYKKFFDIQVLRYLIGWFAIVPLFIHLFQHFPRMIAFHIGAAHIEIPISLPFRWWVLWTSSFAYVIAFTLYLIFCPPFVRTYNSYSEYKKVGHSTRWIVWEIFYAIRDARSWRGKLGLREPPERMIQILSDKQLAKETSEAESEKPQKLKEATSVNIASNGKVYAIACGPGLSDDDVTEEELFWELFGYFASGRSIARPIILFLILISGSLVLWTVIENIVMTVGFAYRSAIS